MLAYSLFPYCLPIINTSFSLFSQRLIPLLHVYIFIMNGLIQMTLPHMDKWFKSYTVAVHSIKPEWNALFTRSSVCTFSVLSTTAPIMTLDKWPALTVYYCKCSFRQTCSKSWMLLSCKSVLLFIHKHTLLSLLDSP